MEWEGGLNKETYINPACDCSAKQFILWPYFVLFGLAVAVAFCAAGSGIACMYAGAEDSPTTKFEGGMVTNFFIAAGIMLLISAIFGVYFLFFMPSNYMGTYNSNYKSFFHPNQYPIKGFDFVDKRITQKYQEAQSSHEYYYDFKSLPNVLFNPEDKQCLIEKDCRYRVAIISQNIKFEAPTSKDVKLGDSESRLWMFPRCSDVNHPYLMFYGTRDNVVDALETVTARILDVS